MSGERSPAVRPAQITRGLAGSGKAPTPSRRTSNRGNGPAASTTALHTLFKSTSATSPRNASVMWKGSVAVHRAPGTAGASCAWSRESFSPSGAGMGTAMNDRVVRGMGQYDLSAGRGAGLGLTPLGGDPTADPAFQVNSTGLP